MILSLATLTVAITSAVSRGPFESWPRLDSSDGNFTIRMPGPVDEKVSRVDSDLAQFDQHVFSCQAGTAFYQLSYVDLPEKLIAKRKATDLLLSAQSGARVDKAVVTAEGTGEIDGSPWRRFRVESPKGPMVSHLLLIQGKRFYHLEVVAPPKNWRKANAKQFFESFSVIQP